MGICWFVWGSDMIHGFMRVTSVGHAGKQLAGWIHLACCC